MERLGELERVLMDELWDAPQPLSAYDLQAKLERDHEKSLAVTTILTVCSRLEKKGFVAIDKRSRPHLVSPRASRSEHMAELMSEVLDDAPDRVAVLERFVGSVGPDDARALRDLLGRSS